MSTSPSSNRTATVVREPAPSFSDQTMSASSPFSHWMAELNVHRTSKMIRPDVYDANPILTNSLPVRGLAGALPCSHAPRNGVGVIVGIAVGILGGGSLQATDKRTTMASAGRKL